MNKVLEGTGNQLASSGFDTGLAVLNPASHYRLSGSLSTLGSHSQQVFLAEA